MRLLTAVNDAHKALHHLKLLWIIDTSSLQILPSLSDTVAVCMPVAGEIVLNFHELEERSNQADFVASTIIFIKKIIHTITMEMSSFLVIHTLAIMWIKLTKNSRVFGVKCYLEGTIHLVLGCVMKNN